MERRKFGNTGVEVSAISLGCWIFGVDWWGHYTDEDGIRLMKFAQDQGITFFDNGDAYGNGRAETMMDHGAKAVQTVYNLFEQAPGREFCEVARAYQAGVLARVHDNSGILKGKMKMDEVIGGNDHRKFRDNAWKVFGLKKLELVRKYAQRHGMTIHQLACKWLLMDPALTSITGTLLNEEEIREACEAVGKPRLTLEEMVELAEDYARNWGLGDEANPCDLKSSVDPSGKVRSGYVPPPVLIA